MTTAVLLSGGVDSSVALSLAASSGRKDLRAFYLKIWLEDELHYLGDCPWEQDLEFARKVCDQWNVPLEIVPLQKEYYDYVVSYVLSELKLGRTPSPDIFCNQKVKFGAFLDYFEGNVTKVISGHYARTDGKKLFLAKDPLKDQTYFLSYLSPQQLGFCEFPVGEFLKSEVRDLAKKFDLATHARPDSQGICFLGKIKYDEFIKYHLGEKKGDIIEQKSQKKLGIHNGYWFHTIGQRKGLRLHGGPWFVVGKNIEENIVYVSHQNDLAEGSRDNFLITHINWISKPESFENITVKVRHGANRFSAKIEILPNQKEMLKVTLNKSDAGIADGQYTVLYQNEICLGAGMISF